MPDFGIYTIMIVIGMMHCTNQQPLNMNCFKLIYTNKSYTKASDGICLPPMGHTVPISINIYSQIAQKCQIFDTLSVGQMMCCITRRDNHCSWSISKPSLHKYGTFEVFLIASTSHMWVPLYHVNQHCLSNSNCGSQNAVPSERVKWDAILWEVNPLSMKCFRTFLRCIRQMGGASESICKSSIGLIVPFSTKIGYQIAHKMPDFLGTLWVCQMRWYTMRRDIHCLWSALKPSLDA